MATAASRAVSTVGSGEREKVIGFSPVELKAPFLLRCAALFIDYMLFLALPVVSLAFSIVFGETSADIGVGRLAWITGIILFLLNSVLLPMYRGQSTGKMLLGLSIVRTDGSAPRPADIFRRNLLGYVLTVLTLGIGFLIAAVNSSGRSLHDLVARTVVVRARKTIV